MRLTNLMRDRIVDAAEKAAFATRDAAKDKREAELALMVRNTRLTPEEIALMDTLPSGWLAKGTYLYAKEDGENSRNYVQLSFGVGVVCPDHLHETTTIVSPEVWAEVQAWLESNGELATDRKSFRVQTRGVVESFKNSTKLLEQWPTLRDLMKPGFFDEAEKSQVPAHNTIATLDAALQAGRPFDAEVAAAA